MTSTNDDESLRLKELAGADPVQLIQEALVKLRFGGIVLTVHEGKLVQMEVTEKRRFV